MDAKLQFVFKVFRRYGVLVAFDGPLAKVPRLPRETPTTLAALSRRLCEVTGADEVRVFTPLPLGGRGHVETLAEDADYQAVQALFGKVRRAARAQGKAQASEAMADAVGQAEDALLEQRASYVRETESHSIELDILADEQEDLEAELRQAKRQLQDAEREVARLKAENVQLRGQPQPEPA